MRGITGEESNGLNGCQYLDRMPLKKMRTWKRIGSKPLFWRAEPLQDFHSALGVSNRGGLEQTEN
jgi:hypothetical protein